MKAPDNRKLKSIRHSVLWKIFGAMVLCIFLLLGFNWLLNNFALKYYYRQEKETSLGKAFHQVDQLMMGTDTLKLKSDLNDLAVTKNISTIIWDQYYNYPIHISYVEGAEDFLPKKVQFPQDMAYGSYFIQIGESPFITEKSGTTQESSGSSSQFIKLYGRLNNGGYLFMQTSMSALEDSVSITNQFLLISGAVTLLISLLLLALVARSFTRPIRQLSSIAQSISHLDFSHRYTGKGRDELADLGNSLNSMSATLEKTIHELQSANQELSRDVERTTKQNEARRAFISNVSHELKTPIALIQTYAEGLREDIADGAVNRDYYCEVIEDESQKMSLMIKKMTLLMQLEDGSEELEYACFDVSELLRNLMEKNAVLLAEKQAALLPPPDRPVMVRADEFLIEHVLTNYLTNAIHHVSPGGRISAYFQRTTENRVRISVYNTGNLIPEEDLERIWESFYKVDKARTRAYGGTGIGLSVVSAIMKAHRMPYGVFNRRSAEETGVEFYLELELAPERRL